LSKSDAKTSVGAAAEVRTIELTNKKDKIRFFTLHSSGCCFP